MFAFEGVGIQSGLEFAYPVAKLPSKQAMPRDDRAYPPVSNAAQGCQNVVPYGGELRGEQREAAVYKLPKLRHT